MNVKSLIIIVLMVVFNSCSTPKEPEFNRMENTRVQKIAMNEIIIYTDAVFDNPNGFGVTVSSIDIIAQANGVEAAEIKQLDDVEVLASKEFAIPLEIKMSPKKLLTVGNILKLIAGSLEEKVTLQYNGTVTAKMMKLGYDIPIDYSEEILFKK